MARIKAKTLGLVVDGKLIEVKTTAKKNFDLNKALEDPNAFNQFAADPAGFAARYDLKIDKSISDQLKAKLAGVQNLDSAKRLMSGGGGGGGGATVWAVAGGAYSVSSSKVAIAF